MAIARYLPEQRWAVLQTETKCLDFFIDGDKINTEGAKPYSLGGDDGTTPSYDTSALPNGSHVLKATANYSGGSFSASTTFMTSN